VNSDPHLTTARTAANAEPSASGARPRIVLDTQVILDWLLFRDPSTARLEEALHARRLEWIAEAGGLQELRYVLGRAMLARYQPDRDRVEAVLAEHCQLLPTPPERQHPLICRDPDDQRFIDLALHAGAVWLLSRDRAVLALAKRAKPRGLQIISPLRWEPE
jgi:putative PIN family toxin of toxin-antitoxin system